MSQENLGSEAVTPEQMDKIAQSAMEASQAQTTGAIANAHVIEQAKESATLQQEEKASAVGDGTNRLPTLEEIQNIDRTQMEKTDTEVLHENVEVKGPDYNYKPTGRPDDTIKDPLMAEMIAKEVADEQRKEAERKAKEEAERRRLEEQQRKAEEEYEGRGIVVTQQQADAQQRLPEGMNPDQMESLQKYMDGMEESMVASTSIRQEMSKHNPNLAPPLEEEGQDNSREANLRQIQEQSREREVEAQRTKEAMIIIDKIEDRNQLGLTPEEHDKLKEVRTIKLNEVKTVDLKSIKKVRDKKPDVRTALTRKNNSFRNITVILPISGYTATFTGCSTYEIMTLQQEEDAIQDTEIKWRLVYEKMISNDLGITTFEQFLSSTAAEDFDTCIWAITRGTFDDEDVIELNCSNPECKKQNGERYSYEWKYRVSELLRPELISERTNQIMSMIVDAKTQDEAIEAFRQSPLNSLLGIVLPESEYVVEISIRNVREFIDKTLTSLASENLQPHYRQAAALAAGVNEISVPLGDGRYATYDDPADIAEIIYNLASDDLLILTHKIKEHSEDVGFSFGFYDVVCPKCRHHRKFLPMDVSTILFYRNALSVTTNVE